MKTYVVVDEHDRVLERRFSAMDPDARELVASMQKLADQHPGSRWGQLVGERTEDVERVDARFEELGTADVRILEAECTVVTPNGPLRLESIPARLRDYLAWRVHHQEAGFCGWLVREPRGLFQAHAPGSPPWILSAGDVPRRTSLDDACGYLAGIAAARVEAKRS